MKKIVFLLITVLVISGAAWAQHPGHPGQVPNSPDLGIVLGEIFDWWNAVPTLSTESRYSAGIFSSMVDDYIDVNWYDPKIGTFAFLGGFPAKDGGPVEDTDDLSSGATQLSLGFGKTLKNFYLGVYYGGNFIRSSSYKNGADPAVKNTERRWANNLALLIGTSNVGAFRLDMIMSPFGSKRKVGDEIVGLVGDSYLGKTRYNAPSFALTWGGLPAIASLHPYVTLAFRFPDKEVYGRYLTAPDRNYQSYTTKEGARFGVQAGIDYDLDDSSSVSADFGIGGQFGYREKGDSLTVLGGSIPEVKEGGYFATGIKGAYKKTIDFGKASIGFKPKLGFGWFVDNSGDDKGDANKDDPATLNFELRTGFDLGFKYQVSKKFALYTGASLQIFDLVTESYKGGDTKNDAKGWHFDGIEWDGSTLAAGNNLGFGLTFSPVENLVIGCGLNMLLDKLFILNLAEMRFEAGSWWTDAGAQNNSVGAVANIFSGVKFDLTVSYKF